MFDTADSEFFLAIEMMIGVEAPEVELLRPERLIGRGCREFTDRTEDTVEHGDTRSRSRRVAPAYRAGDGSSAIGIHKRV